MITLLFLGSLATVALVSTIVAVARDGYRRVPTRQPLPKYLRDSP